MECPLSTSIRRCWRRPAGGRGGMRLSPCSILTGCIRRAPATICWLRRFWRRRGKAGPLAEWNAKGTAFTLTPLSLPMWLDPVFGNAPELEQTWRDRNPGDAPRFRAGRWTLSPLHQRQRGDGRKRPGSLSPGVDLAALPGNPWLLPSKRAAALNRKAAVVADRKRAVRWWGVNCCFAPGGRELHCRRMSSRRSAGCWRNQPENSHTGRTLPSLSGRRVGGGVGAGGGGSPCTAGGKPPDSSTGEAAM